MAPRFIGKTSLGGVQPAEVDGSRVLDRHATLQALLSARLGPQGAALFAEPVPTWPREGAGDPGSVSWYSDAQGSAEPLAGLSSDRRAAAEMRVREAMQRLQPLLDDAEAGPLLRQALALGSPDGIMLVGETPVLVGWGLVPDGPGSAQDRAARAAAWTRAYLAGGVGERVGAPPQPPMQPSMPPPLQPPPQPPLQPGPAMAAAGGASGRAAAVPARSGAWDWALVPAAIVTALLFLGLGMWIGVRAVQARIADRPNTVALLDEKATAEAMQRQREANAALEREIEARKRLLAGNVCLPDPTQMPRLGPDRAGPVPPAMVTPPPGQQAFQGSLAELLTQGVVLILAPGRDGGLASGSGFFVAPGLIVTNRHVIEEADPARIVVTSRKLGRTTAAQIVATTPESEIGGPDIALLRIGDAAGIQPLSLSSTVAPLDMVIAAGFPGLLLQADEAFERLRNGDTSAVPEVILTDGRINAIQPSAGGIRIMPHSAAVSGGNSGGPLVDACGRVVGINTFITSNREQVAHANYAQKADGLIAFLKAHDVAVADLVAPCVPGGTTPAAAPGPATPSPAAPGPATPSPATPGPATPNPGAPSPATPNPATPSPATPDPARPDPAVPNPAPSREAPGPATPAPAR